MQFNPAKVWLMALKFHFKFPQRTVHILYTNFIYIFRILIIETYPFSSSVDSPLASFSASSLALLSISALVGLPLFLGAAPLSEDAGLDAAVDISFLGNFFKVN